MAPSEGTEMLEKDVATLRQEVSSLRADLTSQISKLETGIRVAKHDVTNLDAKFAGLAKTFEKFEEKVDKRFDKFEERLGLKLDLFGEKLGTINTQQARGLGYFAGIASVITVAGTAMLTFAKVIITGHW